MKTSEKREKDVVNACKNINICISVSLTHSLSLSPLYSLIYLQVVGTIFLKISMSAINIHGLLPLKIHPFSAVIAGYYYMNCSQLNYYYLNVYHYRLL